MRAGPGVSDNFPPFRIGVGEQPVGPTEDWIRIARRRRPGHPALGRWLVEHVLALKLPPRISAP